VADDGVCEFPFAGPERPRLLQGKEQILAYMTDYPSRNLHRWGERATRPPRSGPECRGRRDDDQGTAVETDKPYNQQYVIVAELATASLPTTGSTGTRLFPPRPSHEGSCPDHWRHRQDRAPSTGASR